MAASTSHHGARLSSSVALPRGRVPTPRWGASQFRSPIAPQPNGNPKRIGYHNDAPRSGVAN